jgi:hypothetical protein
MDLSCDAATVGHMPADDSFYESRIDFPRDCDWVKVELKAGQLYAFAFRNTVDDPEAVGTFALRAPNGAVLDQIKAFYSDFLQGFSYQPAASGTYYLSFTGDKAADYQLTAGPDCSETKPTACGAKPGVPYTGKSQYYYDEEDIRLTLQAGVTYDIDFASVATAEIGWVYVTGKHRLHVDAAEAPPPAGFGTAWRVAGLTASYTGTYFFHFHHEGADGVPDPYRLVYKAR